MLSNASAGKIPSGHSGDTGVFVRRVDVPAYLAQGRLVTMKGGIQVDYATTARWAEPFGSRRSQGGGRGSQSKLPDQSLWIFAQERLRRSRVMTSGFDWNVLKEPTMGKLFSAVIGQFQQRIARNSIAGRTVDIRRNGWQPGDYPGLVRLLSEEVAQMSREIAHSIP